MLRIFVLFLSAFFYLNNTAHANSTANSDTHWTIHFAFEYIKEQDYSSESLHKALLELKNANTRPALAAAIIISQYEEMSPTLTKGLIDQLSEKTRKLKLSKISEKSSAPSEFVYENPYDGSNESLAEALFPMQRIGDEFNSLSFLIPCRYFYRHPDIGILTRYVGAYNHRWDVPGFEISCHTDKSFAETSYATFRSAGLSITGRPPECGSIYRDYAASRRKASTRALFRPSELEKALKIWSENNSLSENLRDAPLHDWALMERKNYKTFLELEILFEAAKSERVEYYKKHFKYATERAQPIATAALLRQINLGAYGHRHSRATNALLEGQREIRADILSGQHISDEDLEAFKNAYPLSVKASQVSIAGFPQPLLHLAIDNPQTLIRMIALGYDIDVRDTLGKTALMVAAQEDNFAAVATLLENGADVNAVSFHPKNIIANDYESNSLCRGAYTINTGERTALHYALSEASASVVNLIIENGANIDVLDSAGNTMLDYFNGTGPTKKNEKLSDVISEIFPEKGMSEE